MRSHLHCFLPLQINHLFSQRNLTVASLFRRGVAVLLFLFCFLEGDTQHPFASLKDVTISLNLTDQPIPEILEQVEDITQFKFVFNVSDLKKLGRFSVSRKNVSVFNLLTDLLPAGLGFEQAGDNIIIRKESLSQQAKKSSPFTGEVRTQQGFVLPGVSVTMLNANKGAITDNEGRFTLETFGKIDSLQFSSIGYTSAIIPVKTFDYLVVELKVDSAKPMNDVVVLGYGTSSKKNLSTAIGSLSAAQLTERPSTINVLQAIAGKIAGVNVMTNSGKPGGKPTVKIRGMGSLNATNAPLYVIDGFVGADPAIIDPNIIASLSVLKDAAAAAIYGSRGSNGVIIFTTKQGDSEPSAISFSSTVSVGSLARQVDLLDAGGALTMLERQYSYQPGRLAPHQDPSYKFARRKDLLKEDGTPKYNTNWQDEATRTTLSTNSALSFAGGSERMNVFANISYKDQQGIMKNSYSKQVNGYLNLGWDLKPWFHLQATMNAGGIQQNNIDLNTLGLNPLRQMIEFLPFLPVQYADGTYSRKADYPGAENSENPVRLLNEVKSIAGRTYTMANLIGTFHLTDHLDLVSSVSGLASAGYNFYYAGRNIYDYSEAQQGVARRSHTNGGAWTNEDYLAYTNRFGKHFLNVVAGASWYYYLSSSTSAGAQSFFDDYYSYNTLQAGSVWEQPASGNDKNQLNSFYTRANYRFQNKYLFGASFRADGSSRFGANNKYGFFPSFSGGWIMSEEPFFDRLSSVVNSLKIRASYGTNGNAAIGNYVTLDRLNTLQVVFNNQLTPAVTLAEPGNKNLRWEKAKQVDLGLDMSIFKSRFDLTVDLYNKVTSDLLYRKQLPATTGYSGVYDNIGSIRNRGIEVAVSALLVDTRSIKWNSSISFASNQSKVLKLNGDIISTWGGRITEGRPLNDFFGYQRENVWRTDEAPAAAVFGRKPGDLRWTDINKNNITDAGDRVPLGSGMPDFEINFTSRFAFRRFSIFVDLQAMYGNKILNFARNIDENQAPWTNSFKTLLNAWTPQRQETKLAQLRLPVDGNQNPIDSHNIEDGSFIRMRNIAFTYDLNRNLRKFHLARCTVGIIAENYLLITKYSGYDPENTSFDGELNQGVDFFQYPKPKIISFNLSLGL